ncbi:choice-of-anchor W domain-containing protein [Halorarius halobius]|uniref:choice-of-anchor W domain-containing protein n=1 Tax=Halorarius halobius TaxID=2962671 RepID=UPI0020CF14C9|nr:choice-of-anchor W domain-containing protein [Halorarius halobius]
MSDDRGQLTRRKVLGSLGVMGGAAALGGASTMAFFSDEETFKHNELVAGELDLKVDWQEHYSDWSSDEGTLGTNVWMSYEDVPDDKKDKVVPKPDHEYPLLYIHKDWLDDFEMATALEAYPDPDDDGVQNKFASEPGQTTNKGVGYICKDGADTPEDLDPTQSLRTKNSDTYGAVDGTTESYPLVYIDDVKPGDFGELTLSYHLCGNDGYVWLTGDLLYNAENGLTEPERKDPDENGGEPGELAEELFVSLWYDSGKDGEFDTGDYGEGDNVFRQYEQTIARGSLKAIMNLLDNGAGLPLDGNLMTDANGPVTYSSSIDWTDVGSNIEDTDDPGDELLTPDECELVSGNPKCSDIDADLVEAIKIEDDELPAASESSTKTYNTIFGDVTLHVSGVRDGEVTELDFVSEFGVDSVVVKGGPNANVCSEDGVAYGGEDLSPPDNASGNPAAVSHISFCVRPDGNGNGNGTVPPQNGTRECMEASETGYIGLAWQLPVDHANEIQTDSVAFDLGFYTEQCRHNDGTGMARLIPTRRGSGFAKLSEETNRNAGYGLDGANFNGDGTISGGARARFGNNSNTGTWELAAGDSPGSSGFNQAQYTWTSGETVDWTFSYDASTDEASFTFDGTSVPARTLTEQPDGRVAIQCKADEATVEGTVESVQIDGEMPEISGENSVTASNDGSGRDIEYLVLNTNLDGETSFTLTGTATVTLQGDYGGSQEGVAFDVVLE